MQSAWLGESRDQREETGHGQRGNAGVPEGIEPLLRKGCSRDVGAGAHVAPAGQAPSPQSVVHPAVMGLT